MIMRVINADVLFSILHEKMKGAEEWRRISKHDAAVECAETAYDTLYNLKMELEDEVTTIEAEPVRRAKWVPDGIDKWRCSVCGAGNNYAYEWSVSRGKKLQDNYCPHCGARMDGDDNG